MIELAKTISFSIVVVLGFFTALYGLFAILDKTLTYIFKSLGMYDDVVRFFIEREKNKKGAGEYE